MQFPNIFEATKYGLSSRIIFSASDFSRPIQDAQHNFTALLANLDNDDVDP